MHEQARDYFGQIGSAESSHRTSRDGLEPSSRTSSEHPSPHIAYQEKGWERNEKDTASRNLEGVNGPTAKPFTSKVENNRLGKSESARSSRSDLPSTLKEKETNAFSGTAGPDGHSKDTHGSTPLDGTGASRPSNDLRRLHEHGSVDSARSQPTSTLAYPPKRGDSLQGRHAPIHRKEVGASPANSAYGGSPKLPDSVPEQQNQHHTSINTSLPDSQRQQDSAGSPSLSRNNGGEYFSEEELARIGTDGSWAGQTSDSFLRRMSNSVRHGRSFSDKSVRVGKDGKYPRSPANGSSAGTDVGSPTASTSQAEEIAWLRNELRKERQRVTEMEGALRAAADVKQVNTELSEKRSTMVVLDAQREIVLRELTVLTDHLEAEKHGAAGGPLDLGKLSNHVLRELAESIHKLKESYAPQIEDLIQKRNELSEELANLNKQKEKAFQEFEQLSSKNAQLAELNNQLVHQIQGLYKASSDGQRAANGLGIVSHNKEKSITSVENLKTGLNDFAPSVSTAHISEDGEPATATLVPGPQVVSIRKGQPRKFNWKKGGQNVAKGVKGLKGAFMSSENAEGGGSIPRSQSQDPSRQGFGFFGNQRNKQQGGKMAHADTVPALAEAAGGGMLHNTIVLKKWHQLTNSQVSSAPTWRLVWNMKRALSRLLLQGVYRRLNCEVCLSILYWFDLSPDFF